MRRVLLYPNSWNPNRMNAVQRAKLHESIDEFGFIDPILVRPHPDVPGGYEIIGGEHRWQIAEERGFTDVPIIVIDATDEQAKRLTLIDNELHGQADPTRVADLLRDLMASGSVEEMLKGIPFDMSTVKGFLGFDPLPPLPPPSEVTTPAGASSTPAGVGGERWVERTYRLPVSIAEVLDSALAKAKIEIGTDNPTEAEALEVLAAEYLAT